MAEERIRLTISVTPEVHEVFSRMAESGGMSLGKCMGEWLTDTIDGAQFVALKMQEARKAPKVVMREMQAFARGFVDEVDLAAAGIGAGRPRTGVSQAATGQAVPRPPSSNTGGKFPREYPLPPAKVQAHADTNGVPPKVRGRKS